MPISPDFSNVLVTHGYLGCSDPLIPCRNATHCVHISEICLDYHDCNDGIGGKLTCKSVFFCMSLSIPFSIQVITVYRMLVEASLV